MSTGRAVDEPYAFEQYIDMGKMRTLEGLRARLIKQGYIETRIEALRRWHKLHDWPSKIAFRQRTQTQALRNRAQEAIESDANKLEQALEGVAQMDGFIVNSMQLIARRYKRGSIKITTVDDVVKLADSVTRVAEASAKVRQVLFDMMPEHARHVQNLGPVEEGAPLEGEVIAPPKAMAVAPNLETSLLQFKQRIESRTPAA